MICPLCGESFEGEQAFCSRCYTSASAQQKEPESSECQTGFSEKISDPAFAAYQKKQIIWSFIFAAILAVISLVAFPIYGNKSGSIDWPESLFYGIGIGAMFIIIAALQTLKRKHDKTWDGTVEFKDAYKQKDKNMSDGIHTHTLYMLYVRKESGWLKKHKWKDSAGVYDYYEVGDKVRHHKGFDWYEKYDKTKDSKIMCAACLSFMDAEKNICTRCKCPLLK